MTTIPNQPPAGRRRRVHSDEFKANAVASCTQPGVSMAAVAMANGINPNLLRRWVREAEQGQVGPRRDTLPVTTSPRPSVGTPSFVPVALPPKATAPDIRIELRRGTTAITVTWPVQSAAECAAWMRELLR